MATITGTSGNDVLIGDSGNDVIYGGDGNDYLDGGDGHAGDLFDGGIFWDTPPINDTLEGGTGVDTATFHQARADYRLIVTATNCSVIDAWISADALTNIERLQFADTNVALDLLPTQAGGQALEFIGVLASWAVNDRGIVGSILSMFDAGYTLPTISQWAVDVGLTRDLAGSSSDADLARLAYRNIVGVEADANTVDTLVGHMDGRIANWSQGEFLAFVAGLEYNQQHINAVGLQAAGVEYVA
jgi:hypothetical protein